MHPSTGGVPTGPARITDSCRGVDSKNDPAKFVVCVESNVQAFWHRELSGRGSGYHPSKLVLFSVFASYPLPSPLNGCKPLRA